LLLLLLLVAPLCGDCSRASKLSSMASSCVT
jgi:hypothetical protein